MIEKIITTKTLVPKNAKADYRRLTEEQIARSIGATLVEYLRENNRNVTFSYASDEWLTDDPDADEYRISVHVIGDEEVRGEAV